MEAIAAWISSALVQGKEPDPADAPPSLSRGLGDAFLQSWDGRVLADLVTQEVWRRSGGEVSLQAADRAAFRTQPRGPAAYLLLTARRRVLLVPDPAQPVRFDS